MANDAAGCPWQSSCKSPRTLQKCKFLITRQLTFWAVLGEHKLSSPSTRLKVNHLCIRCLCFESVRGDLQGRSLLCFPMPLILLLEHKNADFVLGRLSLCAEYRATARRQPEKDRRQPEKDRWQPETNRLVSKRSAGAPRWSAGRPLCK